MSHKDYSPDAASATIRRLLDERAARSRVELTTMRDTLAAAAAAADQALTVAADGAHDNEIASFVDQVTAAAALDFEQAQTDIADASEENTRLAAALEQSREQSAAADRERHALAEELAASAARIEQLQHRAEQSARLQAELSDLQEQLAANRRERDTLTTTLASSAARIEELEAATARHAELLVTLDDLQQRLTASEQARDALVTEAVASAARIDELEVVVTENVSLSIALEDSQQQLDAAWRDLKTAHLNTSAAQQAVQDAMQSLEAAQRDTVAAHEIADAAKQDAESAKALAETVARQLETSQQEFWATQQQLVSARQELATSQQHLASSQPEIAATQQQLARSQQELAATQLELAGARQLAEAAQLEAASVTQLVEAAQFETASARQDADAVRQQLAATVERYEALKSDLATSASSLEDYERRRDDSRPFVEHLPAVFRAVSGARTIPDALTAVANGLACYFSRVAIFRVRSSRLEGVYHAGFDPGGDISNVIVPLTPDSVFATAVSSDTVRVLAAADLAAQAVPFGGAASCALIVPIAVDSKTVAVIYADDTNHAMTEPVGVEERGAFEQLVRDFVMAHIERIVSSQRSLAELDAYATMLLDEVERLYQADVSGGKQGAQLRGRLRENLRTVRQIYAQRVELEGPAAGALLEERIITAGKAPQATAFARDLLYIAMGGDTETRTSSGRTAQAS